MSKPWSKEAVYDAEISPLMTKIAEICTAHDIPIVAVFQYEMSDDDRPGFVTTVIPSAREHTYVTQLRQLATHVAMSDPTVEVTDVQGPAGSRVAARRVH